MKISLVLCLLVTVLCLLLSDSAFSRRSSRGSSRSSSSRSSSSSGRRSWFSRSRSSSSSSSSSRSSSSSSRRGVFSRIKDKFSGRRKTSSSSGSSYPKQQYGSSRSSSSSYPKQQYGSTGSSSSYPKQSYGSTGTSRSSSSYPKQQYGSAGSTGSSSSYPKQQWGSAAAGGVVGGAAGAAAGSSYPKQKFGSMPGAPPAYSAGGFSNTGKTSSMGYPPGYGSNTLGGGGFVKPGTSSHSSFGGTSSHNSFGGASSFGKPSKTGSFGSTLAAGGLGAAGGYAAGSIGKKYSYPKSSWYSKIKTKTYSHRPGYGTAWGTNFAGSHMYKPKKKGFSKKALGLGVAAGFVGGAALGAAGTMATYSVYHRYQNFKNMMRMRGYGYSNDWDDDWYQSYTRNECMFGCPINSHCEWGFCECNYGFNRRYGQCVRRGLTVRPRAANFNPFATCDTSIDCQRIDMNMICNTKVTVQSGGKCECKRDMKWNEASGECQLFLDVDCSSITYETPPSKTILTAVAKAQAEMNRTNPDSEVPDLLSTPTIQQSLDTSLLSRLDSQVATANEMKEAFCRDVDTFSMDFQVDPNRPPRCEPVPNNACGVVYDSHDCTGGWRLIITQGEISFPFFSSYWKYRNDIDLIGVAPGCTLTGYSGTSYSGRKGTFKAPDTSEFWWMLEEYAEFQHLDSDIESIQCVCTRL